MGQWRPTRKQVGRKREEVPPSRHLALVGFGTSSSDFLWAAGRETGVCTGATERKDRRQLMLPRSRFSLRAREQEKKARDRKQLNWVKVTA